MKKYAVIADPGVKDDLMDAKSFLESRRTGYGKKFILEYRKSLILLQKNPYFQVRYLDVHCYPMKTFKYMIHYKIDEEHKTVHVYAVLSTYLDPDKHYLK